MPLQRIPLNLECFQRNLKSLNETLTEKAASRGFPPPHIVVVSKYLTADDTGALRAAGITPLGENRVNDLIDKTTPEDAEGWHFIGHLQSNKIAKVLPRVSLLHSLDSERLAHNVHRWAQENGVTVPCLVQVNIAEETQKGGLTAGEALSLLPCWATELPGLHLRGLMTMAPLISASAERDSTCRSIFRTLRELRDQLRPSMGPQFCELSMGMSGDAEIAAEEGATWVRVGSRLYQEL